MAQIPTLANFRRTSIADQASAALRQAIHQGALGDPLPGEHHLARQLGISRSSLRGAMLQLAGEGLIVRGHGRRARLQRRGERRARRLPPVVCVVAPISRELFLRTQPTVMMDMHLLFATKGIRWEEFFDAKLSAARPERRLKELVASRPQACWMLLGCSEPIQRWFAQAKVAAFIAGSCGAGIALPSVDPDYRAVGWHAAGAMIQHGHMHLGLLQHRSLLVGDRYVMEGFQAYLEQAAPSARVSRILVDADYSNLESKMAQLAACRHRPTALLCVRPALTLGAIVNLQRCGLRIPRDISIISRDSHQLIDASLPDVTRYSGVSARQAARAVSIAQALIAGRYVPPKPTLVFPSFIAGKTLGPIDQRRPSLLRPPLNSPH